MQKLLTCWRCERTFRQNQQLIVVNHNIRHFTAAASGVKMHSESLPPIRHDKHLSGPIYMLS